MAFDESDAPVAEIDEVVRHLRSGREVVDAHVQRAFVELAHGDGDHRRFRQRQLSQDRDGFGEGRRKDYALHVGGSDVTSGLRLRCLVLALTGFDDQVDAVPAGAIQRTNQELAELLKAGGFKTNSKNFPNAIGTNLWREANMERGIRREGKAWALIPEQESLIGA